MPEAIVTPEEGAVEQQAQPVAPVQEITPEYMESLARSGNTEEMERVGQFLMSGGNDEPPKEEPKIEGAPSVEPATKDVGEQQAVPEQEEKKGVYVTQYRGNDVAIDDPDGFFGRKDADGLKKSFAHKESFINELTRELKEYREKYGSVNAEYARLKAELEAAKVAPVQQPTQKTPDELPLPPEVPTLPSDQALWTDEESVKWNTYIKENAEYTKSLRDYVVAQKNAPAQVVESPETRAYIESQKKEAENTAYWNRIRQFQNTHKSFTTPDDIQVLHEKCESFADQLAYAMGETKPLDPEGAVKYETRKNAYIYKYLNGDQDVLQKADGITPPQGYDKYYDLANLEGELSSYKDTGRFGPQASLHDAYVLRLDESGQMESFVNQKTEDALQARVEGKKEGIESLAKVMDQSKTEAITVPNDIAQQSTAPTPGEVSRDDMIWFQSIVNPVAQLKTPAERERYDAVGSKLGLS